MVSTANLSRSSEDETQINLRSFLPVIELSYVVRAYLSARVCGLLMLRSRRLPTAQDVRRLQPFVDEWCVYDMRQDILGLSPTDIQCLFGPFKKQIWITRCLSTWLDGTAGTRNGRLSAVLQAAQVALETEITANYFLVLDDWGVLKPMLDDFSWLTAEGSTDSVQFRTSLEADVYLSRKSNALLCARTTALIASLAQNSRTAQIESLRSAFDWRFLPETK